MLSRLKSTVKGVLGIGRGQPAAPPPPARPAARVEPPKPAAKPAEAPKAVAKPAEAPKAVAKPVEAPKAVAKPVEPAKAVEPAKVAEAPKAAEPAKVAEAPKAAEAPAEAKPKKESLAAKAAAAAKAPAPAPARPAAEDEDDGHADDAGGKATRLAEVASAAAAGKVKGRMVIADMHSTDVDAYIARAKANGRDPATYVVGAEGLNVLDDGTRFWGPVNNDSSRSKAAGLVLTIDQNECISCGTCVEQTNRVFYLPADGKATPIAQDGPMDLIEDAIEACPVTCIQWVSTDEAIEKGHATGIGEDWSHVVPEH